MANGEITIRDANLPRGQWRNFSGRETKFNPAGKRSFTVFLDPDIAQALKADGWNVKFMEAREADEEGQHHLSVAVSFEVRPPTIVLITSRGRRNLTEDEVEFLDWFDYSKVDMIIRPYAWSVRGESGVKAYLKSIYCTVAEDELAIEYSQIPEDNGTNLAIAAEEFRDYIEGEIVDEAIEADLPRRAIESGRR